MKGETGRRLMKGLSLGWEAEDGLLLVGIVWGEGGTSATMIVVQPRSVN